MADKQRIGIGKVVMREKQYLAAIRPFGKGLAMSTMLFADEVVAPSDIDGMPDRKPSVAPREKKMAAPDRRLARGDWDPKRYHDDYEEQVRRCIKAKAKGKAIEAPAARGVGEGARPHGSAAGEPRSLVGGKSTRKVKSKSATAKRVVAREAHRERRTAKRRSA